MYHGDRAAAAPAQRVASGECGAHQGESRVQEPARLTGEAPASDHGCFPQCPRTESLQTPPRRVPSLPCRSSHSPSFPLGLLPLSSSPPSSSSFSSLSSPYSFFPLRPPLTAHPLPLRSVPRPALQVPSHLRAHRSARASPAPRGAPPEARGLLPGNSCTGSSEGMFS